MGGAASVPGVNLPPDSNHQVDSNDHIIEVQLILQLLNLSSDDPLEISSPATKVKLMDQRLDNLFHEIALKAEEGRINMTDRISLLNLLHYYRDLDRSHHSSASTGHISLKLVKDKEILIQAHKYTCSQYTLSANSNNHSRSNVNIDLDQTDFSAGSIPRSHFKLLLTTIFLFSHLWDIFESADCQMVDRRISRDEFMASKELVFTMLKPNSHFDKIEIDSDKKWLKRFLKMDREKRGFITFDQYCEYTVRYIEKPEDYLNPDQKEDSDEEVDDEEESDDEENKLKFESVTEAVNRDEEAKRQQAIARKVQAYRAKLQQRIQSEQSSS